jgi:hypothetical protein
MAEGTGLKVGAEVTFSGMISVLNFAISSNWFKKHYEAHRHTDGQIELWSLKPHFPFKVK